NGNAIGTTVAAFGSASALKNSTPKTISSPRINITIEPATANDFTSTPSTLRNFSPRKRNNIINPPEISVAFNSLIPPTFSFNDIKRGIEPMISITAKSVKVTVSSSSKPQTINRIYVPIIIGIQFTISLCAFAPPRLCGKRPPEAATLFAFQESDKEKRVSYKLNLTPPLTVDPNFLNPLTSVYLLFVIFLQSTNKFSFFFKKEYCAYKSQSM